MANKKTLEEVGVTTDGTVYWVGENIVRRQKGEINPLDGQNGFTAEQITLIAADIRKMEKRYG